MKKNVKKSEEKTTKARNKGITLIALVVTIVVLLILAGITITAVLSDGGIFNTAKRAQTVQEEATIKEKAQILLADAQLQKLVNDKTLKTYIEENNYQLLEENEAAGTINILVDGYNVKVKEETLEILEIAKATADDLIEKTYVNTIEELQQLLDNATSDITIGLTSDMTGDFIIRQRENVDVAIYGQNHKFDGTIYIYGQSRHTGEDTVTIKNVKFETERTIDFISCNSNESVIRYAHNVTIENCSFVRWELFGKWHSWSTLSSML